MKPHLSLKLRVLCILGLFARPLSGYTSLNEIDITHSEIWTGNRLFGLGKGEKPLHRENQGSTREQGVAALRCLSSQVRRRLCYIYWFQ